MSKKHRRDEDRENIREEVPTTPRSVVPPVREHRRCPSCWGTLKGKGVRQWSRPVSGRQVKTCYQCDQCGHNWTVVIETVRKIVEVDNRRVQVEYNEIPDIETR